MSQALGNRNEITAVCQGNAGACMAELMRMEVSDPIPFFQLLKIPGRSLRIHRLGTTLLGKHKLADTFGSLLCTEALQQINYI